MAKYLKKFQGNAQYEAYTASTVFITPNVSYCASEGDIHYTSNSEPPTPVIHVSSVILNKSELSFDDGESEMLVATVLPADATNKEVTWTSSDDHVAMVDNGKVMPMGVGNAVITVTTDDGGYTAQCNVTVTNPVTAITLDPSHIDFRDTDPQSYDISVEIEPSDATSYNITVESNNTSVARINSFNGHSIDLEILAVDGEATITVTDTISGVQGICTITAENPEDAGPEEPFDF